MRARVCDLCGYSFELVRPNGVCNSCTNAEENGVPIVGKPLVDTAADVR